MEEVIIHDELETKCVIGALETHKDADAMESFAEELQSIPPEIMEKVMIRLYEEGLIKKMMNIMKEIYAENEEMLNNE